MIETVRPEFSGSFWHYLHKLIEEAFCALNDLPRWEKPIHIFWLSGPFILLIERTPADIWLSVLALIFMMRSLYHRNVFWLKYFWVQSIFAFWVVCIISAGLSISPSYSLGEAVSWFRFPLFLLATVFWFGLDKRLLYAMFLSTGLGMMVMTGILTAELLIEGHKHGRLTWPYGDLVPGNYLTKAGLPAFCVMVALAFGGGKIIALVMAFFTSFTLSLSVLTGERINLILRLCAGVLAGLSWRFRWQKFAFVLGIFLAQFCGEY